MDDLLSVAKWVLIIGSLLSGVVFVAVSIFLFSIWRDIRSRWK